MVGAVETEDREEDAVISDWEDIRRGVGRAEDDAEDEPDAWWAN